MSPLQWLNEVTFLCVFLIGGFYAFFPYAAQVALQQSFLGFPVARHWIQLVIGFALVIVASYMLGWLDTIPVDDPGFQWIFTAMVISAMLDAFVHQILTNHAEPLEYYTNNLVLGTAIMWVVVNKVTPHLNEDQPYVLSAILAASTMVLIHFAYFIRGYSLAKMEMFALINFCVLYTPLLLCYDWFH